MKISFMVTYFNQEKYVKQSLESILQIQIPIDWEILIGDDGSSDNTIRIVNEYVNKYPNKIFLYQMPRINGTKYFSVKRASENRLNLLSHAKGDFFCYLDGDDYYCDSKFVIDAINILKQHNDVSAVGFGFKYYNELENENSRNKQKFVTLSKNTEKYINKYEFLKHYYIHAGACVFRKCFDENRISYLKSIGYFDDNDIVFNNLYYGEMYSIPRVIYAYRQTGKSVFTSMADLEKAILNILGYDVDVLILTNAYKNYLTYRNIFSLYKVLNKSGKIKEELGIEKFKMYKECSSKIPNSILYQILCHEEDKGTYKYLLLLKKNYLHNMILHISYSLFDKIRLITR